MSVKTNEIISGGHELSDLKGRTIRGGFVAICAQAIRFFLRITSLVFLARLLMPEDFGLVGMVTSVTGILGLIKTAGLSTVTIQRFTISEEQISTLFWLNVAIGTILTILTFAMAPVISAFYHEPRLFWVTIALASGFLFTGASAQHQAILQRQMRYTTLSLIDIVSLSAGVAVGIVMAIAGLGYWALVSMAVVIPVASAIPMWVATGWVPGSPKRNVGIRSMLHFGGTVTLNSVVIYLAYNVDKILLGRYWGAGALGIYGRAYQLIKEPTDQLYGAIGWVAFPALSRIQDDVHRFRKYFLKGYSLVIAMTIPITVLCAVCADDIILVLLGPKWKDTIEIFRLLVPTVLAFALINPFSWLLFSTGQVGRSLKMALVIAPLVILAYATGLRYGPTGVATGFSLMMTLLTVPLIMWAKHGMPISSSDILHAVKPPFLSGIVSATLAVAVQVYVGESLDPLPRLIIGSSVLLISYILMLFFVMKQKDTYFEMLRELTRRS